jgi:competence ComEA-like helix-hairpin-helix protein
MAQRTLARCFFLCIALCVISFALPAKKKPPAAPINLNTATSDELQLTPGIGPVTAEKILQMRKSYGAFKSVDDLLAIRGLGAKRLEKMRKYLTVAKAAPKTSTHPGPPKDSSPPLGSNSWQQQPRSLGMSGFLLLPVCTLSM